MAPDGARIVLDEAGVQRAVVRIAHEIVERNRGADQLGVVGIRSRGDYLALRLVQEIERLQRMIAEMENTRAWRLHRFTERLRGRDSGGE